MDFFGAVFGLVFFVFIIFLLSRVAHFMRNVIDKLNEIDRKLDEMKDSTATKD